MKVHRIPNINAHSTHIQFSSFILQNFSDATLIFINGSKSPSGLGAAFWIPSTSFSRLLSLPFFSFIFHAGQAAIFNAIEYIIKNLQATLSSYAYPYNVLHLSEIRHIAQKSSLLTIGLSPNHQYSPPLIRGTSLSNLIFPTSHRASFVKLNQLRFGHNHLSPHLCRIGKSPTPNSAPSTFWAPPCLFESLVLQLSWSTSPQAISPPLAPRWRFTSPPLSVRLYSHPTTSIPSTSSPHSSPAFQPTSKYKHLPSLSNQSPKTRWMVADGSGNQNCFSTFIFIFVFSFFCIIN